MSWNLSVLFHGPLVGRVLLVAMIMRAMWRDWGFAPALLSQAKLFIDMVKKGESQEACIRASILFSMMSFEAYFRDVVREYIETNRATISAATVQEVEEQLAARTGIERALNHWPAMLTGQPSIPPHRFTRTMTVLRNTAISWCMEKSQRKRGLVGWPKSSKQ